MLKEGKPNNANNFEKEYTVTKRIEDMSKNEKLKYMFKLLPKYWGDSDEKLGVDKLRKALYYKTQKGKTIVEQLKEIKFDSTIYKELDQFLFWLTYIILTHSKRKVVTQKEILPNQKLIKNIKDMDIDSNMIDLVIYFFVVGDTYIKIKQDNLIHNEKEIVEEFNKHFFFIDRRYEDIEYYRDERVTRQISTNMRQIFNEYMLVYAWRFEVLKLTMDEEKAGEQIRKDIEKLVIEGCQERNNKVAKKYEQAYYDYLNGEDKELYKSLRRISKEDSISKSILLIECKLQTEYVKFVKESKDFEDIVFSYIRCIIFLVNAYRMCVFKNIKVNEKLSMQYLTDNEKKTFEWLDELRIKIISTKFDNDIFLHFGTFIYMRYYKQYYEYNTGVLAELIDEAKEKECCSKIERKEKDNIIYSENYIINSTPKELLEYFIPDENERKPSDRNEIKNKLKYTLKVMDELANENPIFEEPRYAKYVRIMYFVIYGNYDSKYRVDKHMPKKLYLKQNKKIKNSESIIMTERYIYERFVTEGKVENYRYYSNIRKDLLSKYIKMLESVIEMKSDMKVEDKTEKKIGDR